MKPLKAPGKFAANFTCFKMFQNADQGQGRIQKSPQRPPGSTGRLGKTSGNLQEFASRFQPNIQPSIQSSIQRIPKIYPFKDLWKPTCSWVATNVAAQGARNRAATHLPTAFGDSGIWPKKKWAHPRHKLNQKMARWSGGWLFHILVDSHYLMLPSAETKELKCQKSQCHSYCSSKIVMIFFDQKSCGPLTISTGSIQKLSGYNPSPSRQ